MTLSEILETVYSSSAGDWEKLGGITFYTWVWGGKDGLVPRYHDQLAVYTNDIDISLAFGGLVVGEFRDPWAVENFSSGEASSIAIWLRYRGEVVKESVGVVVDGERYLVPLPQYTQDGYMVVENQLPLARLLFDLYGSYGVHKTVEEVLKRAKIKIVD